MGLYEIRPGFGFISGEIGANGLLTGIQSQL